MTKRFTSATQIFALTSTLVAIAVKGDARQIRCQTFSDLASVRCGSIEGLGESFEPPVDLGTSTYMQ
ncbi:MAG: hypothetical protein R3F19_06330 [Verrucomicrobiales bacterium]